MLVIAMVLLLVLALLLNVAANAWWRASSTVQRRLDEDRVLVVARGGVRLAAPVERAEAGGTLKVVRDGDRFISTFSWTDAGGRMVTRTAVARLDSGGRLVDWEER
jgi:hypothetical protein